MPDASAAGDDAAVSAANETHLFHVSNATGEMVVQEVPPVVEAGSEACHKRIATGTL